MEKIYIKIKDEHVNDEFQFSQKLKATLNGAKVNGIYYEKLYIYESEKDGVFGKVFINDEWLDVMFDKLEE